MSSVELTVLVQTHDPLAVASGSCADLTALVQTHDPLADARGSDQSAYTLTMTEFDRARRRWLERLGLPVDLGFPFAAIEDVFPLAPGISVATAEIGTGAISSADCLEAVGFCATPIPVEVLRLESPDPDRADVTEIAFATAGSIVGAHLGHDPDTPIVPGQCIAPAGCLSQTATLVTDTWCLPAEDLPGTEGELQQLCDAIRAGHGLELFIHTRSLPARASSPWRPTLGDETVVTFELDVPVAIYPGVRFGLRYEGLTFGAGFMRDAGA